VAGVWVWSVFVVVVVYVQKCSNKVVGLKTGSLSHVARQLASGVGES
jgi:hypothetical protein